MKTPLILALVGFLAGAGSVWTWTAAPAERPAFAPAYQHCDCGVRPSRFTPV